MRTAPRSSAPSREGDCLHHAVEELEKLAPQPGEETTLAERRALHDVRPRRWPRICATRMR